MSIPFPLDSGSTTIDLLQWRATQQPNKIAYEFLQDGNDESLTLTYGELSQQARAIAQALRNVCELGDRALILHPPGLSYIAAFFGCLYGGVIAVPAYPPRRNRSVDRILAILKDAQPKVAVTTQNILALLKPRILEIPELRTVQWLLSDRLDSSAPVTFEPPIVAAESLAFLQYTSGSTAEPKGVMISHQNILHNLSWMHQYLQVSSDSRAVIWLPPYHDMGLIAGIIEPLYSGFPVTLMSPLHFLQHPIRWLKAISDRRATFSGGPSFAYELCVKKISLDQVNDLDLSSWRVAFNGAEPIQAEVIQQFSDKFAPYGFQPQAFHPCYGMAEATLMVTWRQGGPLIETNSSLSSSPLVSSGPSLGDQTVVIVNSETGEPCKDEIEGEIWVSGGSIAQGYWNRDDLTQQGFYAQLPGYSDNFLRTGDFGFLKGQELFVTGRCKDLLIFNGMNYHPQDLERAIAQCHVGLNPLGIATVSLFQPEKLLVVVELSRHYVNKKETFDEILRSIRSKISQDFQLVTHHILLLKPGQIPKTSSGKIQRYLCRTYFLDGTFSPLLHHYL